MNNFLIDIVFEPCTGNYMACYSNGQDIFLGARDYHDAVLEADMLNTEEYE